MHPSLLLLPLVSLVAAGPAALPGCPNNACYPVLTGPIKDIAQGFCSYYLKYPRSTTTTVKTTVTSTSSCTIQPTTLVLTATTSVTAVTQVTVTETIPGAVISATVTARQGDVRKRVPVPGFTPPKGAGPDWKPPQLSPFPSAVVSAACSCIATPTTTTFTTTSTGTTTVPNPCTKTTITTTGGTVTNTVFITVTDSATTILPATTVTVTVAPPAATCSYPENDQRGVRGSTKLGPASRPYYTETGVASADVCYNNAKSLTGSSGQPVNLQSYAFQSEANPGSPDGPGTCYGYTTRSCENLLPNPAGNRYGGDTSLPY